MLVDLDLGEDGPRKMKEGGRHGPRWYANEAFPFIVVAVERLQGLAAAEASAA